MLAEAARDELPDLTFLDLDHGVVDREFARMPPPGVRPSAEHS